MNFEELFGLGPPAFFLTTVDAEAFGNLYLQLTRDHREAAIRMIRGAKCETVDEFFNESAAALQFPEYFGENWPAFDECIADLDWLLAPAYLVMVSNAQLLLSRDTHEDFGVLVKVLSNANREWVAPNQYIPRTRLPTPFHVLFQCPATDLGPFSRRLAKANTTAEVLV